jgi:hypothetical protein
VNVRVDQSREFQHPGSRRHPRRRGRQREQRVKIKKREPIKAL